MGWSITCTRAGAPGESQLPKFLLEKIAYANLERTFRAATDLNGLQKRMPAYFPSVRILSARGNVSISEEHRIIAGREFVMTAKHIIDHPRTHEVFVIGGHAKGSHIVEKFSADSSGTRIVVDIDMKLKGTLMISQIFQKNRIRDDFVDIFDKIAEIA